MPMDPCLCSPECEAALWEFSGTNDERRKRAGIQKWEPPGVAREKEG